MRQLFPNKDHSDCIRLSRIPVYGSHLAYLYRITVLSPISAYQLPGPKKDSCLTQLAVFRSYLPGKEFHSSLLNDHHLSSPTQTHSNFASLYNFPSGTAD